MEIHNLNIGIGRKKQAQVLGINEGEIKKGNPCHTNEIKHGTSQTNFTKYLSTILVKLPLLTS